MYRTLFAVYAVAAAALGPLAASRTARAQDTTTVRTLSLGDAARLAAAQNAAARAARERTAQASARSHQSMTAFLPSVGIAASVREFTTNSATELPLRTLAWRRGVQLVSATRRDPLPADQRLRAPGTHRGHPVQLRRDPALPVIAYYAHGVRRRRGQRRTNGRRRRRERVPHRAARGGRALRSHRRLIPGR